VGRAAVGRVGRALRGRRALRARGRRGGGGGVRARDPRAARHGVDARARGRGTRARVPPRAPGPAEGRGARGDRPGARRLAGRGPARLGRSRARLVDRGGAARDVVFRGAGAAREGGRARRGRRARRVRRDRGRGRVTTRVRPLAARHWLLRNPRRVLPAIVVQALVTALVLAVVTPLTGFQATVEANLNALRVYTALTPMRRSEFDPALTKIVEANPHMDRHVKAKALW